MSIGLMNEAIFAGMLLSGIRMINNGLRPVSAEEPEAEQRETYRTLAAFAAEHGAVGECLEIGAGLGEGLPIIQAAGDWRVAGLDGSRIAALAARRRGRDVRLADIARMPIPDNSIEHILGVECVVCLDHPEAGLKDIARILRPGGALSIAEFRKSKPRGAARRLDQLASDAGLRLADFRDLTERARNSVQAQAPARAARLNRIPPPFRKWARELSAVEGSARYEEWMSGKRCYYLARLEKPLGEKA